ncbi:MAG TPA: VOC family protein [Thermomicrobiales bacterium]|nr:VOC family protein [Thermomicrobiales bacterium]
MDPWISLITLGVRDVERSRRFYRDGLGWPVSAASTESVDVAFVKTGGVVLALYKRELLAADAGLSPEGSGFAGIALAHNVATREMVDTALEAAVDAGGTLLKPGTEAEWGGYTGYLADPDGFLWEIAWNPSFPLREDGSIDLP